MRNGSKNEREKDRKTEPGAYPFSIAIRQKKSVTTTKDEEDERSNEAESKLNKTDVERRKQGDEFRR